MSLLSDGIEIETTQEEDAKKDIKPGALAGLLMRNIPFARDSSYQVYYYENGVYRAYADKLIGELVIRLTKYWGKTGEWKPSISENVTQYIGLQSPPLLDRPPCHLINLRNGVYDWEKGVLLPHDPMNLSTVQLPIDYDPLAKCPAWDTFIDSVFPEGKQLLYELLGLLMIPYTRLQKTVLILGPGSNGKGTFLRAIDKLLGCSNVSHVSLHQLEEEKFSRGMIVGKLVNIFGDLPTYKIDKLNFFKALTGEDTIQIEYKGKTPFAYDPYCRLIFSGNKLPESDDSTEGYMRRWLVIPFTRKFHVDPSKGEAMAEAMGMPNELSGVFNKAVALLPNVVSKGFTISEEIASIISNYQPIPSNVELWIKNVLVEDATRCIPSAELYNYYTSTLRGAPGEEAFSRGKFITYLKSVFPKMRANQVVNMQGKAVRCHVGIKLMESMESVANAAMEGLVNGKVIH